MQNRKVQLWALSIAGYNCQIEYIAGTTNTCADLLSRVPDSCDPTDVQDRETEKDIDIDIDLDGPDNALEVNVIDSSQAVLKDYASCQPSTQKEIRKPTTTCGNHLDMKLEQTKDKAVQVIKDQLEHGQGDKTALKRYIMIEGLLYFISEIDDEPNPRLYVPEHLQSLVIKQYHDDNGHMGIDKTFDAIKLKYYWPNLYKNLYQYISKCVTCQARIMKKQKPPLQETDTPPYPFAKISMDLSGPYPTSLSGNKYIISFVDHFSGWPEAFAVPDKTAETVAHLLIEEIFPRHGSPLQILSDNGSENINRVVRETLAALGIHHVTTSYYHPQSNSRVERFHRTLHDVLAKKLDDNLTTWDLHLNQTLAAIRFNISESTKCSPFFLLYHRDVVLPIDNLLQPRRKYLGEDEHKIALQQQHKSFLLVHRNMKKAKRRQAKYADRNSKPNRIKIGDPVYYRLHQRKSKLQNKWKPFYRVIDQTSPVTYIIRNQLDGTTTKAHAEHLRIADIDEWDPPKTREGRPKRKSAFVVPPSDSSSDEDQPPEKDPLKRIARRYRRERSDSENEDDIPLAELARRLKSSKSNNQNSDSSTDMSSDESTDTTPPSDDMTSTVNTVRSVNKDNSETDVKVKDLLKAVARLL